MWLQDGEPTKSLQSPRPRARLTSFALRHVGEALEGYVQFWPYPWEELQGGTTAAEPSLNQHRTCFAALAGWRQAPAW